MSETAQNLIWSWKPIEEIDDFGQEMAAGVCGSFLPPPGCDPEVSVSQRLAIVIKEAGLEEKYRANFLPTQPLVYGLWTNSPLTRQQAEIILDLFTRMEALSCRYGPNEIMLFQMGPQFAPPDWQDAKRAYDAEGLAFLDALRKCVEEDRPLYVSLCPPGHYDLGASTTHVHCPRCKAHGPFPDWRITYPAHPIDCPVCGFAYVPADTKSHESEYSRFICTSCGVVVSPDDVPRADLRLLHKIEDYAGIPSRMAALRRVHDFFVRYPDLKDKLEKSWRSSEFLMSRLEEYAPEGERPLRERPGWTTEDRETVWHAAIAGDYVEENIVYLEQKLEQQRVEIESIRVACRACGKGILVPHVPQSTDAGSP